jgi:methylglutaconyl-CoA hydratase
MAKKAIDQGMEISFFFAGISDMGSALAVEGEWYEQLLHTQYRLGLAEFAEKRMPVYTGE